MFASARYLGRAYTVSTLWCKLLLLLGLSPEASHPAAAQDTVLAILVDLELSHIVARKIAPDQVASGGSHGLSPLPRAQPAHRPHGLGPQSERAAAVLRERRSSFSTGAEGLLTQKINKNFLCPLNQKSHGPHDKKNTKTDKLIIF